MYRYFHLFSDHVTGSSGFVYLWGTKNVYDVGRKTIIRLKAVTYASP